MEVAHFLNQTRYSKVFTTIEPTLYNVCEYWFLKDQNRLRDLRVDSLSQMLNLGNIRPGGKYLAVDDASGMLVAGILERMGGSKTYALPWIFKNLTFIQVKEGF
jgi:tRNA (adenine-N(1)-)-methyltransferase non-catalytic subunit